MEDNKPDFEKDANNWADNSALSGYPYRNAIEGYKAGAEHGYTLASERYKKELEEAQKPVNINRILEFAEWYSGMESTKVYADYKRYMKEKLIKNNNGK
jgi:hypothetical protein